MTLASLVVPPGGQGGRKVNYVHSQSWKPHLTASQSTSSFKQGPAEKQIKAIQLLEHAIPPPLCSTSQKSGWRYL